ncbi:hypothetical protein [Spongiimicrobium salis]|uniref:hypothetical protein n=1 Tax=Spongiimicrobium salis TaxID=1667022 RepID=UPI00374D5ED7
MKKQRTGWFIDPTDERALAYIRRGKLVLGLFHDAFIAIDSEFGGVDDYEGKKASRLAVLERIKQYAKNVGMNATSEEIQLLETNNELKIYINGNRLVPVNYN